MFKRFSHPLADRFKLQFPEEKKIVAGWGYRPSGRRAQRVAKRSNKEFLLFEDAPVRSIKPGYFGALYGITTDATGAMFDASGASDLIANLQGDILHDPNISETIELFKEVGISKYNWSLSQDITDYTPGVLLVDQTKGDAALEYGGVSESDFSRLFDDALKQHPKTPIYIKTHPDHTYRAKKSCFTEEQLTHPRVVILPADLSPADCFKFCHTVYVGTSLMGMEALLHQCEVITYGWNFYTGWGVTTDRGRAPLPPRKTTHTVEELFQAAYIDYAHYYDPDLLTPCSLNDILKHIARQKKQWARFSGTFVTLKANRWKRHLFSKYIKGPRTELLQLTEDQEIPSDSTILMWGAQDAPPLPDSCSITRVEDGFIRSKGLGAKLTFPMSWVFDDIGIYFDARTPSKLENILNSEDFTEENRKEAKELRLFLCENRITKYNLRISKAILPAASTGKKTILVPGQVDSDASIKFGSPKLGNNRELLHEVRKQNPDAYIFYKPHPDLLSGARKDKPLWDGIEHDVDHLIKDGDIISWIEAVDEVHTLTSTVGFEALMHGKPVHTYGLPFYAGWGLTHDWLTCDRRSKNRSLDELVYAALIEYPTYLNPKTGEFTSALKVAKLLSDPYFTFDARPNHIKAVGFLKSFINKFRRE